MQQTAVPTPFVAARERRVRHAKLTALLAVAGGVAVLVGVGNMIEERTTGAAVTIACGFVALVAGAAGAAHLMRTVRYRIAKTGAGLLLAIELACALLVFVLFAAMAHEADLPPAPRSLIVLAIVGGLSWVVHNHEQRTTLLQADATGLRLGRNHLPWPRVAEVVVRHRDPQAAVVQAYLTDGTTGSTLVPLAAVDPPRLTWAVTQSGRPLPLRFEPQPPTPTTHATVPR